MSDLVPVLYQPHSVQVELMQHSGVLDVGGHELYVLWEEFDRNATMMVRVLAKHPTCTEAEIGKVYVIKPFRYQHFLFGGEFPIYVMDERFLEAEIEGYDEAADSLADATEGEGYAVCGKA